jgi:hypothetical protein
MAIRLEALAEGNHLLPKQQMGARNGESTRTALDLLVGQTHAVWQSGEKYVASMLSLDMAGAFDNASYPRLLHILKIVGIPEWVVKWVESFLTYRRSTIRIDNYYSEQFVVPNGIPQGSPVSPILFLFYNRELIQLCNQTQRNASGTGFVDDANLLA